MRMIHRILIAIKYILNKGELGESNMIEIFNEIRRDIKNYELEMRIEELESKFSNDFNENFSRM